MRFASGKFVVLLLLLVMVSGVVLVGLFGTAPSTTERKSPAPVVLATPANFLYINPPSTAAMAVGSTVTLSVKVASFAQFNAWDISVQTDPSILNPTAFMVPGFGANATTFSISEFTHCINGGATQGGATGCTGSDGAGIVHSAIAGSGSPPVAPVFGTLFTITYSVVATGGSYVHIFNDGLSLAGVDIAHTAQDGVYGSPGDFRISYAHGTLPASYIVTVTSLNGFVGPVSLSGPSSSPPSLTTTFTSATLSLASGGTASTTLKVTEGGLAPTGFYNLTVSGSGTVGGISISRSAQIVANLIYLNPTDQPLVPRGATFTIQVKVANIDPFNTWDIAIKTDPTLGSLSPTSFSLTGNLLAVNFSSPVKELIHCVNGVVPTGFTGSCVAGVDGPGVVHSEATVAGGVPMSFPTSGLLFTITYTGGTKPVADVIHFSGAIINNGSSSNVGINSQDGFFGTPASFTATPSPAGLTIPQGTLSRSTISLASVNSFAGTVTLSASISPLVFTPPTFSVTPSVALSAGGTSSGMLTVTTASSTNPGFYVIKVNATGTVSGVGFSQFPVISVLVPDFKIAASPASPNPINQAASSTSSISLTSLFNFTGSVTVTSTVTSSPAGAVSIPTLSPSPQAIPLTVGGTVPFFLTISTTATTTPGTYTITATGVFGSLTHSAMIILTVLGPITFTVAATPNTVSVAPGTTSSSIALGATLISGTAQQITFSLSTPPNGVTSNFTPSPPNCTPSPSCSVLVTFTATLTATTGTFTITLTGTATGGETAMNTFSLIVGAPGPVASIGGVSPAMPEVGITVTLTASSSGLTAPLSYNWSFGDGSANATTTVNTVTHTYLTAATVNVAVTITDTNGAKAASPTRSVVVAAPLSGATVTNVSPASPEGTATTTLAASSSGGVSPLSYNWSFGDGTANATTTTNTVTHVYAAAGGTFNVAVTITDTNGVKSASPTRSVTVAAFLSGATVSNVAPASPEGTVTTTLTSSSTGGVAPLSYNWSFGDGTANATTTTNTVTHVYAAAGGTFNVAVTITDADGVKSASPTRSVTVAAALSGATAPSPSPASPEVGIVVTLTTSSTGGVAPLSYNWSFGDGSANMTTTTNSVTHTYSTAAAVNVAVTLTDANGVKSASPTRSVVIAARLSGATVSNIAPASPEGTVTTTLTASSTGGVAPLSYNWSFGDGTVNATTATNTVTHVYAAAGGTFNVAVTITDTNGVKSASPTKSVVVAPVLSGATVSNVAPASPEGTVTTTLTASSTGGVAPLSYNWSFGDGTANATTTTNTVTHVYAAAGGTFNVAVTITDTNGVKSASPTRSVVVAPALSGATVSAVAPASPEGTATTTLTASSTGGVAPLSYNWSFGDGSANATTTTNTATHVYAAAGGTFNVAVTITDTNGVKSASPTRSVTVAAALSGADFNFSPVNPCGGVSVTFTASSTGGITPLSYNWSFGDGTGNVTTTTNSVPHTFTAGGTFSVAVTITDANGVKSASPIHSVVVSLQCLSATVSNVSPASPEGTITTTFTASATGGIAPLSYNWSFGDGSANVTTTTNTVNHVYAAAGGTFNVAVTVTDSTGVKFASPTRSVVVAARLSGANISAVGPASPEGTVTTTLTASSSGGVAPLSYNWSFGDSTANMTTATNTVTHVYAAAGGTFNVAVTITDTNGVVSASPTRSVVVAAVLSGADFTFLPPTPSSGQTVTFTASSTGGVSPLSYLWRFGDGASQTTTTNSVTHIYTTGTTANFVANVTITDANGVSSTSPNHNIPVTGVAALVVDFGPQTTIVGNTTFIGTISGGTAPFTCTWGFGDGTPLVVASCSSPVSQPHIYIASGTFTANLTVTSSGGSRGFASHAVIVEANPSFIHGKLHWTHHLSVGTTQSFTVKFANPTTFTVDVTITIDIFRDTGVFVTRLQAHALVGPGSSMTSYTNASLIFTPTLTAKYHFSATISYSAIIPTGLTTGPQTTTVTGTDGSKSGSFVAV